MNGSACHKMAFNGHGNDSNYAILLQWLNKKQRLKLSPQHHILHSSNIKVSLSSTKCFWHWRTM